MDDAEHSEHRPHLRASIEAQRNLRRRSDESLRAPHPYERARSRLGETNRLRILRRKRLSIENADLRQKQSRYRHYRSCEKTARKTSPHHRFRLRQTPWQNLPPLQHGRRKRRNRFAFARLPRRRSEIKRRAPSFPKAPFIFRWR